MDRGTDGARNPSNVINQSEDTGKMSAAATETPAPTTGVLGAAHRVRESAQHVWSQQKPMSEILDANAYA